LQLELIPPAPPSAPGSRRVGSYTLAALLGALSLFTTVTLGGVFFLGTRTDVVTDIVPLLLPETVARVWGDPTLRGLGFRFALPTLFILLCHELGHYLVCRKHGLPATPPYFVPAPIGLGTFGAFIRIRGAIRNRRQLLEVGVSGPIAGFAALLPFLLYGVAHSRPVELGALAAPEAPGLQLFLPGQGLLTSGVVWLFHGALPAGAVLNPHPFLLAAWVGLFATMLNLLPLGQLDGGHILYAALGRRQPWLAWPLWGALALVGLAWPGWWLWCVIVLVLGLRHPPLVDEAEPLDRVRTGLALAAALLFALSFMPVPIREVVLALR
jgi:membrane-associated protease RseP (regulator of RpoE activity)